MSPMAMAVAPQERQLGTRALRLSMNYSEWRSVGSAGVITVLAAAAGSVVSADCSSSSAQALRFVFSGTWQCSPRNISLIFFHFAEWLRRFIYLNPTFYGKFPLENGGTSDLDVAGVDEFIVKVGEPGEGLYIIFKGKVEILRTVEPSLESGSAAFLSKGEHFGQACLGPEKPGHTHNIIAHSEVSCIVIPHEQAQLLSPASTWRHEPGELAPVERLLQLKCIKDDLFQSYSMPEAPTFWANMYGGHMVGLALGAACKTVDPSLGVHSLHSYFLRSGNPNIPIDFKVERIRDGQTFATRQVQAMQKGKICFTMYASFQRAESGLEFQYSMPTTTGPSELPTYEDLLGPLCDDKRLSRHNQQASSSSLKMSQTLDLRYVDRRSPANLEPQEPRQRVWMRSKGKLSDDPALHRCAASYAFDWSFLETALGPHNKLVNRYPIVGLSLDHSTWFHRPFWADEYVLVVMESPRACDTRALCIAQVYSPSGELVASMVQEGSIRVFTETKKEQDLVSKL